MVGSELDFSAADGPVKGVGRSWLQLLAVASLAIATFVAVAGAAWWVATGRAVPQNLIAPPAANDDAEITSLEELTFLKIQVDTYRYVNHSWESESENRLPTKDGILILVKLESDARKKEAEHVKKYTVNYRKMKELSPDRWAAIGDLESFTKERAISELSHARTDLKRELKSTGRDNITVSDELYTKIKDALDRHFSKYKDVYVKKTTL